MKIYYIFIPAILLSNKCFSQEKTNDIFYLHSLPADGIVLDKGWTFYAGDDPRNAKYDQKKNGIPVNPASQLEELPFVRQAGIGWFCLRLQVDSSLQNKTAGIIISLLGAAEVYLNGERVYQFGNVSGRYDEEKTQNIIARALNLKFGNNERQILALRYSNHPKNLFLKTSPLPECFRVVLYPENKNTIHFVSLVAKFSVSVGISLVIALAAALLTLFFFLSFRHRREYLYFGLALALQFIATFFLSSLSIGKEEDYSINKSVIIGYIANIIYIIDALIYLNGMYILLKRGKTRVYWVILTSALIVPTTIPFLPLWGGILFYLYFLLFHIENTRINYRALKTGFRGAKILFYSHLICILTISLMIGAFFKNDFEAAVLLTAFSLLTPALGVIIFLAQDFAKISISLQSRIVEVEELSKKNIAQEKEKQGILETQKERLETEVQNRTADLNRSIRELKETQAQLIQSEKMASLGQLTAGIAHEIQNPLNFVNNFSEINKELLGEMKDEIDKGNLPEVRTIANDVIENEEKINHHGKRADAIVKGMLQHSRSSTGLKEPTDINKLADEYLRLSYHGLRAKDKMFNATLKTDFDESIGNVNIIPRDIGRVILNLITNAFYIVDEKKKQMGDGYEPTVSVSTKKVGDKVLISVKDNGNGIPLKVLDKIFQPFFTTKPTGQGTGLGLSLAYDIVKAHGGDLKVETKEGEGSEFVVSLPG